MRVYRLTKTKFVTTALDGFGASQYGGRWNTPGSRVAYTSLAVSTTLLEVLVHHTGSLALAPAFSLVVVEVDDAAIAPRPKLPEGWRGDEAACQAVGDAWLQERHAVGLLVPSAVSPRDLNVLLHVDHPGFAQAVRIVETVAYPFDERLIDPTKRK